MFRILFEVLLIEIQEEIHHFAGWGGLRGTKIVNRHLVSTFAFPKDFPSRDDGKWTRSRHSLVYPAAYAKLEAKVPQPLLPRNFRESYIPSSAAVYKALSSHKGGDVFPIRNTLSTAGNSMRIPCPALRGPLWNQF